MDVEGNAMTRLLNIQKNLHASKKIDDIFDISFIYSTLERFAEMWNFKVSRQCLNIINESLTLMEANPNDVFESQMPLIVRSVVQCLDKSDLSNTAESLLERLCLKENYATLVRNQIQKNKSDLCAPSHLEVLERIMRSVNASETKNALCKIQVPQLEELHKFQSQRRMSRSEANIQGEDRQDANEKNELKSLPKVLDIEFIPQSMVEEWLLARSADDMSNVLEEVTLVYSSIPHSKRLRFSRDIPKIVKQTLHSLKLDDLAVIVNGLLLLEMLAEDHATEFVPDLSLVFPAIQRYMDDPRVAIRHHALRLGGAIVIRIPFSTTGRFVFAAIEYKPQHPEISLKCAALALLSVQPKQSKSFIPLISRMIIIAGDYLDTKSEWPPVDIPVSPREQSAVEAAKDLTAIALMLICASSISNETSDNDETIENKLPLKLASILGISSECDMCCDICGRALLSNFPSLATDSKLSTLAALAMEISLRQDSAPMSARRSATIHRALSGVEPDAPFENTLSTIPSATSIQQFKNKPGISIQIPSSPAAGATKKRADNEDTPMATEYPMGEGSYMPSWTPTAEEGRTYSSLASPWAIRQDTPTEVDRTKLKSIKRGGRKPGSRLRARTADETSVSDEWGTSDLSTGIPSTAGGRLTGGVGSGDLDDNTNHGEANIELGPGTPLELGVYSNDGIREHKLDSVKSKIPLAPKSFAHMPRRRARTDCGDVTFTPDRSMKKLDSLAYSYDEADEDADSALGGSGSQGSVKFDHGSRKTLSVDSHDSTVVVKAAKVHSARPAPSSFHIKGNSVFGSNGGADSMEEVPPPSISTGRTGSIATQPRHRQLQCTAQGQDESFTGSDDIIVENSTSIPVQDAFEYLATEDLEPCAKPTKDIASVATGLYNDDWPQIFQTLNTVRQLAVHHKSELSRSGQLHHIVLGVNKQVENLRSAAAKNAILALGDLFYGLQTGMDAEVPGSSSILLKRIADSSVFISESVDNALGRMISHVTPSRSLLALLGGVDNRTAAIRGQSVRMLLMLFTERHMDLCSPKDNDILLPKLRKILADTSLEARTFGKEIVRLMINRKMVSREVMEDAITVDAVDKVMRQGGNVHLLQSRYISQTKSPAHRNASPSRSASPSVTPSSTPKGVGQTFDFPKEVEKKQSLRRQRTEELAISGTSPRGATNTDGIAMVRRAGANRHMPVHLQEQQPELLALPGIFLGLSSKNWQERRDNLSALCDSMVDNEPLLTAAGKMEKCMEGILDRFEDGSVKVSMFAVSCARRLQNAFPQLIPGMLTTSLSAILGAASSANKQVSVEGSQLLHALLVACTNDAALSQQLVGIALHDKERLRAASFRAMSSFVNIHSHDVSHDCKGIMKRTFFPVICQTLCAASTKPEVKTSAADTLRVIQSKCSERIETWTESPQYKDEIRRLLM